MTRNAEESKHAESVLALARAGRQWDSGTLDVLKSAFRGMAGDKEKLKLKKAEFMPCIIALVSDRIALPSSAQLPPAAGSEEVDSPVASPICSDAEEDDE